MEKVINLKSDQIFRHAVHYNDALDYSGDTKERDDQINPDMRLVPCGRGQGSDLRPGDTEET